MTDFRVDNKSLLEWAAHEAGHAVAAFEGARNLGFEDNVVIKLMLDKRGEGKLVNPKKEVMECRAFCFLSERWIDALRLQHPHTAAERRRAMRHGQAHLVSLLAGPYAQLKARSAKDMFAYDGNPDDQGIGHDMAQAHALRHRLALLKVRRRSWLKTHQAAKDLVEQKWRPIEENRTSAR